MSVEDKRDRILERIYDDMLDLPSLATDEAAQMARVAETLEKARDNDCERRLKMDIEDIEDCNKQLDREHQKATRLLESLVNTGASTLFNIGWAVIMVVEMHKTRVFEETGTETSVVSRWLKNSFPKFKTI